MTRTPDEITEELRTIFRGKLTVFGNEIKLHEQIDAALTDAGVKFQREVKIDAQSRVDFVIETPEGWRICLEVKTKKTSRSDVFRQIGRYFNTGNFGFGIILSTAAIEPLMTEWLMADGTKRQIRMINTWMDALQ